MRTTRRAGWVGRGKNLCTAALAAAALAACTATVGGTAAPARYVPGPAVSADTDPTPTTTPAATAGTTGPTARSSAGGPAGTDALEPGLSTVSSPSGSGSGAAPSSDAAPSAVTVTTTVPPTGTAPPQQAAPPATVDVAPLLVELTAAMDSHDREAFLAHFTPAAAKVAGRWWDNLDAIGFDAGSVAGYADKNQRVSLDADGSAVLGSVMAGAHHPSDGTDADGVPVIGTTQYRVKVHWRDGGLVISRWQAVRPAPWDCTCQLQAIEQAGAVVVTTADAAPYGQQVADAAAQALDFQQRMLPAVGSTLAPLTGAVIFATTRASDLTQWFRTVTDESADVNDIALAFVRDLQPAFGDKRSSRTIGSSRLAIGPMDATLLAPVLVHELVHYRLFELPLDRDWLTEHPVIPEGIATFVTELYFGTPADQVDTGQLTPDHGIYSGSVTAGRVDELFTGELPTAEQLRFGSADEIDFWYVISASVFAYLSTEFGVTTALDAAVCAYTGKTVFGCAAGMPAVSDSGLAEQDLQSAWAEYVRTYYR